MNVKKAERLYAKSLHVLKSLQLKNGGILASPPGKRYPYVYVRDSCECILSFISAGFKDRAKLGLSFIFKTQKRNGSFPQRVDRTGKDRSYKPLQLDCSGLVLYAFAKYVKSSQDVDFAKKYWKKIEKTADFIKKQFNEKEELVFTMNSLHEFPIYEEGLEIWANTVCCAGLREIVYIGKILKKNVKIYENLADKIKNGIKNHMWDPEKQYFIKNIRLGDVSSVESDIDPSAYGLADFEVFDDINENVRLTVKAIERGVWNPDIGGICRYQKHIGRNNGGWGPWPLFTLMICRHFIRLKNRKKAGKYLEWVLKYSYKDLLPEHIATKKEFEEYVREYKKAGILRLDRRRLIANIRKHPLYRKKKLAYSTIPLAWAHAEFIRTWNLYKDVFKVK